jgi:hypothetical protein
VLFCKLPAELVKADALHALLSDNAPATPNAATAPFRPVFLAPDIDFSKVSDLASMAFASLWFQDAKPPVRSASRIAPEGDRDSTARGRRSTQTNRKAKLVFNCSNYRVVNGRCSSGATSSNIAKVSRA